jgi:hypothetical protein
MHARMYNARGKVKRACLALLIASRLQRLAHEDLEVKFCLEDHRDSGQVLRYRLFSIRAVVGGTSKPVSTPKYGPSR